MNITHYISRLGFWRVLLSVVLVLFGVFFFIYGGYDDSPGGQLLGLVIAAFGLWRLRHRKQFQDRP